MFAFRYLLCLPLLGWLLLPAGVCPCHLTELLIHEQACDVTHESEPGDHEDNCPCAKMPSTVSSRASITAAAGLTDFVLLPSSAATETITSSLAALSSAAHPPAWPIYLTLRALRN